MHSHGVWEFIYGSGMSSMFVDQAPKFIETQIMTDLPRLSFSCDNGT